MFKNPSDYLVEYCAAKHAAQTAWLEHARQIDALYPSGYEASTRRQRDLIDAALIYAIEAQQVADAAFEAYWQAYRQYERERACNHQRTVVVEDGGMSLVAGDLCDNGRTVVVCRDCGKEW